MPCRQFRYWEYAEYPSGYCVKHADQRAATAAKIARTVHTRRRVR